MPVTDAEIVLRDGLTDLVIGISPETEAGVLTGVGPYHGMLVQVLVPEIDDPADTLDIVIEESADNVTYVAVPDGTVPQISDAGYFEHLIHWCQPYLRTVCTVVGATADFGAVTINLTPGQDPIWQVAD